jgi:hypothetical protein
MCGRQAQGVACWAACSRGCWRRMRRTTEAVGAASGGCAAYLLWSMYLSPQLRQLRASTVAAACYRGPVQVLELTAAVLVLA